MVIRWQGTALVLIGACLMSALGSASLRAWSQEGDSNRLLRDALVSPTTAYVALPPDFLCADGDNEIIPSPDGKDVLVQHAVLSAPRSIDALMPNPEDQDRKQFEAGGQVSVQLLLYSQGDDHAQVVWRGGGSMASGLKTPTVTHWLPGTRNLLVEVESLPGPLPKNYLDTELSYEKQKKDSVPPTTAFLLINGVTGKSQTIAANIPTTTRMIVSLTNPVVVLVDSENATIQRMDNSKLGPLLPVRNPQNRQERISWISWNQLLPDNRTLDGIGTEVGKEGGPPGPVSYRFDTMTGVLTRLDKPVFTPFSKPPLAQMPLVVRREKAMLSRDGVTKEVHPLWLEGQSKETVGRVLIAPDSDVEQEPVVLESAVVYKYNGAVYAVPVLKSGAPEFLAQRHEKQKRETLDRAKAIGLGMKMYAEDYDKNLPPSGSNFLEAITPYVSRRGVFENPATGQNGFTTLYRGTLLSAMGPAATTPLASLGGPGGVAILYADGHVEWKDSTKGKP